MYSAACYNQLTSICSKAVDNIKFKLYYVKQIISTFEELFRINSLVSKICDLYLKKIHIWTFNQTFEEKIGANTSSSVSKKNM